MKLYSLIIDQALADPWELRDHALGLDYRGAVGPDGVTYPNISTDVPAATRAEVADLLSCDPKLIFFRLNLADTVVPHWAHTDTIMASHLAILYLTLPQHCVGGTSIVEHVSGMQTHPKTDAERTLWRQDTNRPSAWRPVTIAPMRFNRMVILPSDIFHASVPQGFGSSVEDGRLVLITFFDKEL